jgi:hypothetical protein
MPPKMYATWSCMGGNAVDIWRDYCALLAFMGEIESTEYMHEIGRLKNEKIAEHLADIVREHALPD